MTATQISAKVSDRVILGPFNIMLKPRTPLAIVGESGAGKTTLLRVLAGWDMGKLILGGELNLFGECLYLPINHRLARDVRRIVHLLPQTFDCLCPLVTILGHIRQMDFAKGWSRSCLIQNSMDQFRSIWPNFSPEFLSKYPGEFSGGEIRRLALVLMLLTEGGILLVDEPTSGVDYARREEVIAILQKASVSRALAYTTHDLGLVEKIGGEILLLRNGQLVETASIETFFIKPRTDYAQTLVSTWKGLTH